MSTYHVPVKKPHRFAVGPTTWLGKWAVGLVAATVVLAVAAVTVVPGDSILAWVVTCSGFALTLAGGIVLLVTIVRRGERALTVYAAALVLVGGVLFLLLHSLVISD